MPAISYQDFSGGLDRRLPVNVLDASHQWVLRNAFVTNGKRIRKRPCLKHISGGLTGSYGLENVDGYLCVFSLIGSGFSSPGAVTNIGLSTYNPAGTAMQFLGVSWADMYEGYPYVVSKQWIQAPITGHPPGGVAPPGLAYQVVTRHHYVDGGGSTLISDSNCPHSASVTKAASRIFAINGETVRYCAAGDARDWTTSSDAGFLPTGTQQDTKEAAEAVGTFQDALVVFFPEGAQIWNVAVDPTANSIRKRITGAGCKAPLTLASWANDLAFLSPYGFRSMTVAQNTDRIDDTDIGVPIDDLVTPDIATSEALSDLTRIDPFGVWIPQLGQYWCVFDNGTTSKVWAYSYSKSSKINCWSEYTLPVRVTGIATVAGKVYVRSASDLYEVDKMTYTDNGNDVAVEVQMAFQDAKSPGVNKYVYAADYVLEGSPQVSFLYDPRDLGKETIPQTITGDTRPGELVPIEISVTSMAPVFRHEADEAFELTACTFYYEPLGVVR